MFLREARVVARLKHNNIVATHEFGEIEGSYFVSMEYLPGEDLAAVWDKCRKGVTMPVAIAMALIEQAATGLHYAHEARDSAGRPLGLVHRDVNPANLFVTYDGVVKLLDFGIVKNSSGPQRTAPGIFKGTYGYCAPEQVVGGAIDRQTDVFCLGIVFWELLTGRRLFDDGNQVTTIDAVRSRKIEPPSKLRPEIPAALKVTPDVRDRQALAWRRLQAGDLRGAQRDFAELVKREPAFYPAETGLGYVALADRQYKTAVTRFTAAVGRNDRYLPAWQGLSEAEIGLNNDAGAIAARSAGTQQGDLLCGFSFRF